MLRIFLLRHGQTIFNTQDICQGWNDSPLTEMGLYQPKCTGYGLRKVTFTKAYSGDTQRQIDTAKQFMSQNENPVDIIPDTILGIGIIDDLAVLGYCAKMVKEDLDAFRKWREKR